MHVYQCVRGFARGGGELSLGREGEILGFPPSNPERYSCKDGPGVIQIDMSLGKEK